MKIPEWADESLSRDLPILRSRGESQDLEYKQEFPKNARDLGKEIAAFATSNTGTIIIGVSDFGELVGLPSCHSLEERDQILQRLGGISTGTVKPSVIPTARFAIEGDSVVLVISVPKGSQPVYYSNNIPYIRHLTDARPANPHEVLDRVSEYLEKSVNSLKESAPDEKMQLYSVLARILVRVLIFADQAGERMVNPWLNMWRSEFGYAASELRELATSQISIDEGDDSEFRELSILLDKVANLQLYLGSGPELEGITKAAGDRAGDMFEKYVGGTPIDEESLKHITNEIVKSSRQLRDLVSRAEEMADSGHFEQMQGEASDIGLSILKVIYYNIDPLGEGIQTRLKSVGRLLHLTETMGIYMDGGRSTQAVIHRVEQCSNELQSIVQGLKKDRVRK